MEAKASAIVLENLSSFFCIKKPLRKAVFKVLGSVIGDMFRTLDRITIKEEVGKRSLSVMFV
jgi:hypothetical protein